MDILRGWLGVVLCTKLFPIPDFLCKLFLFDSSLDVLLGGALPVDPSARSSVTGMWRQSEKVPLLGFDPWSGQDPSPCCRRASTQPGQTGDWFGNLREISVALPPLWSQGPVNGLSAVWRRLRGSARDVGGGCAEPRSAS